MTNHFEKYFINAPRKMRVNGTLAMISSDENPQMGFFFESAWHREPCVIEPEEKAYAFDLLYVFVGQDFENQNELCGELSFTIAEHEYVTDKTCMILVPKNTPHGPIRVNRVDRPFFTYCGGASKERVPESRDRWVMPEGEFRFERYVLHGNGEDNNEAEQEVLRLHGSDNKIIGDFGGVFYGKFRWFRVTTPKDFVFAAESHSHGQPELLNFYSTDPDDPYHLGATISMEMMGERYEFDRTTTVFAPANQPHCPLRIMSVERPFMFFTLMPDCKVYSFDK